MTTPTRQPTDARAGDRTPAHRYGALLADEIERKWQARWEDERTFVVPNPGEPGFDAGRPKFYCLDMFPYPSGAGLHVGHPEGYTATDIICRYKRMNGFNVLHPMGWDAFGLPAEQYAIQTGVHPAKTTKAAIDNFRRQLKRFGFCYDWSREFATIDQDYYRWTQWIFLQLYDAWFDESVGRARPIADLIGEFESGARTPAFNPKAAEISREDLGRRFGAWEQLCEPDKRGIIDSYRLAYVGEQTVNWCPKLGTALANEEVIDGKSERGGYPVLRTPLRQWMFRITAYAERLLKDLDGLDWPVSTRTMQGEWIGRSEGAEIDFEVAAGGPPLRVFTTRPDTLFGATFMVVAPEHPIVEQTLAAPGPRSDTDAIRAYVDEARHRSDVDRQESKVKTGVDLGVDAVNPATGEPIPVWVADYVLMGYGFGAIMGVPAGDQRDYEFAKTFGLPIRDVVYPRHLSAMRHFARAARPEQRTDERWQQALADLLGIVTAEGLPPARFDEAMEIIATRRECDREGTAVAIHIAGEHSDAPGETGERRGAVSIGWLDALGDMGLMSFDQLATMFGSGTYQASAGEAWTGDGYLAHSGNDEVSLNGLRPDEAKKTITDWLTGRGIGRRTVNYRLRDWLFSRQRYWGEPFPIVYDGSGAHHGVSPAALPVTLPALEDYHPIESDEPVPLLGKAESWVRATAGEAGVEGLPPDAPVRRETNTMPGWAGSCWYYLRYCDPRNSERFASREAERYWMVGDRPRDAGSAGIGVDLYVGGAEHAVLHLLYARFWHKVLFDLGHVSTPEPFAKLFHQGLITSYAFQDSTGRLVPVDEVEERAEHFVLKETGEQVSQITAKMSKTLKNVVNPDDVIAEYGADTFRLYEMYMGPLEASKPWDTRAIGGMHKFLQRAWRVCVDEDTGGLRLAEAADEALERQLHRTIAKVGQDIERLAFNTAIASMIELVNAATAKGGESALTRDQVERFALILAPFVPHMGEELWSRLGHGTLIADAAWPAYDPAMLVDEAVEVPVQILGKVRARIMVPAGADAAMMEKLALADEKVGELLAGKTVRKVIAVPGRMVNIVAN